MKFEFYNILKNCELMTEMAYLDKNFIKTNWVSNIFYKKGGKI